MSQVNKFKQDQNPDFLYFDLQQTNIYNTTENIQQPLKFIETRDTPIVANSGDYHLSVTRFQLDTYNLPVLVVEPDLTQTGNYDPNQTIYKVAMIPKKSNLLSQEKTQSKEILIENTITNHYGFYGRHIAQQVGSEFLSVAIGQYNGANGKGQIVYITSLDDTTLIRETYTWDASGVAHIGLTSAGLTNNAAFLISNGEKNTAGVSQDYTLIWDRLVSGNNPYKRASPVGKTAISQISGYGTRLIVAEIDTALSTGSLQSVIFNQNTGAFTNWGTSISAGYNFTDKLGTRGIGMNEEGTSIVFTDYLYNATFGAVFFMEQDYAVPNSQTITTVIAATSGDYLGTYVCMSGDGLVVAVSGDGNGIPFTRIYNKTTPGGVVTWTLGQTLSGGAVTKGDRLSLNDDGTILYIGTYGDGTPNSAKVKRFKKASGSYIFEILIEEFSNGALEVGVASNASGEKVYVVEYDSAGQGSGHPSMEQFYHVSTINVGDKFNLPNSTENVPIIKPVIWSPDYKDAEAPNKNVLTGKNTAFYQYYYCNAYENFIARVNLAIRDAYKALIEELYNDWVIPTNNLSLTNVFLDIVLRQYAPPPFLEWNEAELKAELYATLLFQSHNNPPNHPNETPINYSCNPDVVWSIVSTNRVGTPGLLTPLEFQIAMNAPLYSLFNSLPASKKVLTAPVTLYKENYYILNFFTTGNDLVTPHIPLQVAPNYSFITIYDVSGVIQYPTQYTANIAHSNQLLKQPQELSTIDTWTPINAIVFTTTSLPIVVNQFSASSSIGDKPPSGSTSNEFAFIITDIQSNEQGFRPNVLYAPSAQFRYIDLTGNQPIRNIDISIFWRTTTGALIPMVLASGAQASIKLLFEKKDKSGQKEANGFIIDKGSGFNSSI